MSKIIDWARAKFGMEPQTPPEGQPLQKNGVPINYGGWANLGPMGQYSNQPGVLDRIRDGVKYIVDGVTPATWFSPAQPLAPYSQESKGRQFDYQVGYNLNITPRSDTGITFYMLRALADSYDILRLLIENRKDQMEQLEFIIVPKEYDGDPTALTDPRIKEVTKFLAYPDKILPWKKWLRALMEDMLVIDAATIYPRKTRGGKPYALELMDGGTIKPVIDADGRRPMPPSVAFQQIIKGVPMADYAADQIYYTIRNPRTNRVYGYSPVEQIIVTINIAMRRQTFQLDYYTEGSIPDALIAVPETWNPDQIAQFEGMWNSMLAGNLAQRRRAKFVPAGTQITDTRAAQLKDDYDEWLARVCCFAFGTSPQPFIKMMNRATAETLKATADEEGLLPWAATVKDMMDRVIFDFFGYDDLEFTWKPGVELDPMKRAQADDVDLKNGTKSVDEVRVSRKLKPIGMGNAIYTTSGPVMLQPIIDGAPSPAQARAATPSPAGEPVDGSEQADGGKKAPGNAATDTVKVIKLATARATLRK